MIQTPSSSSLPPGTLALLRHLTHELRQPLSGIETTAYYLDMVLPADPVIREHFDRLRQMVQQANWILDEAARAARALEAAPTACDINQLITAWAQETALESGRGPELELTAAPALAEADPALLRCWLETAWDFFTHIVLSPNPILVATTCQGQGVRVTLSTEGGDDAALYQRLLDPPCAEHRGSLRRLAEAQGATLEVSAEAGCVRLCASFPPA